MQNIIYDVAVSADGFICGADGDVSRFPHSGPVVDDYRTRLGEYGTVLMGRATYEFGYAFGLAPGDNPYTSMKAYVFSKTIALPKEAQVKTIRQDWKAQVKRLQKEADAPIYLCGGGDFAGQMLEAGLIDRLRLKRAPIFYGAGVRVFGTAAFPIEAEVLSSHLYPDGVLYQEFALKG